MTPPVDDEVAALLARLEAMRRNLLAARHALLDKLEVIDSELSQVDARLRRCRDSAKR